MVTLMADNAPTGSRSTVSRPARGTSTSSFGAGRRESQDANEFYARFTPPIISADASVHGPVDAIGDGACFVGSATDMFHLPDDSVALVVTSPLYLVGKEYELAVTADVWEIDAELPADLIGAQLQFAPLFRDP